jgi:murein DD-endopeptidase MepM/ murein hydrolase activator NlpD
VITTLLLAVLSAAPASAQPAAARAAFERFSVLTPAGPEQPRPEVLAKSRRLLWAEHRIQKGEGYIGNVAKNYGTTLMSVQTTNNNELVLTYPGMRLTVLNRDGHLYEVRKASETLDQIVAKYHVGTEARRRYKEVVVRLNNLPGIALLEPYEFSKGDRVVLPGIKINFDTYRVPFETQSWGRISSRFGYRFHPVKRVRKLHEGLDIPKPYGTPIYPSRSGRVKQAGWDGGYGMVVVIQHSDGWTTRYGHMSKILVKPGDVVARGKTMIGRVGSTGISTGPHLHFEVRDRSGRPVNPQSKIGRR